MSGIVGIINLDRTPVDQEELKTLTNHLVPRGPDAQQTWQAGHIGLGFTLFKTTLEAGQEKQPCSLDGKVWIVADARIDGRNALKQKLSGIDPKDLSNDTDPELILHAYNKWGSDCVNHLIGDFAFAIWDDNNNRLFCARDHFGVKPFFYVHRKNKLIFSNTLSCILIHPEVSRELNDLAIADTLLFGYSQEPSGTAYKDILRLPAAHFLVWEGSVKRIKGYWALPADGYIRYRSKQDYIDNFLDIFKTAVADRLRTDKIAVSMSGGLDSTSVAAIAAEQLSQQFSVFDLRAYTSVYEKLIPDEEGHYASLAAEYLNIPHHCFVLDDYKFLDGWDAPETWWPEPLALLQPKPGLDSIKFIADQNRVMLTGDGGDIVFKSSAAHIHNALRKGKINKPVAEVLRFFLSHGRLPPIGIRTAVKKWFRKTNSEQSNILQFINKELVGPYNLIERWHEFNRQPPPVHPERPEAYNLLTSSAWQFNLESYDSGTSPPPIESRHPFMDKRLVEYLLAMPTLPWFINKELLRVSMVGKIPEEVRQRAKAPMAEDPLIKLLEISGTKWADFFKSSSEFDRYVDSGALSDLTVISKAPNIYDMLKVLSLNIWFQQQKLFLKDLT